MNKQQRIAELEAEIERIRNEPEQIDLSEQIGALVMVRDKYDEEWYGPYELTNVDETLAPYDVKDADCYCYAQAKLYNRTKINWVPHVGDVCPVDGDDLVILKFKSGYHGMEKAKDYDWSWDNPISDWDITHYSILDI